MTLHPSLQDAVLRPVTMNELQVRDRAALGRVLRSGRATRMRAGERLDVDGWDERWNRADDDCIAYLCVPFGSLNPTRDGGFPFDHSREDFRLTGKCYGS